MSDSVPASAALASEVAAWVAGLSFGDLPDDVVATTKLRVLDVIGLSLAGSTTPLGHSVRAGVRAMAPGGPSRVWGGGDRTPRRLRRLPTRRSRRPSSSTTRTTSRSFT